MHPQLIIVISLPFLHLLVKYIYYLFIYLFIIHSNNNNKNFYNLGHYGQLLILKKLSIYWK
jgi:hypothetical protein